MVCFVHRSAACPRGKQRTQSSIHVFSRTVFERESTILGTAVYIVYIVCLVVESGTALVTKLEEASHDLIAVAPRCCSPRSRWLLALQQAEPLNQLNLQTHLS